MRTKGWNPRGVGFANDYLIDVDEEINAFSDNVAEGTDPLANTTGFTKLTSTDVLSSSTTYAHDGTRSLKVITPNVSSYEGFYTDSVESNPSVANRISAWLKGVGTVICYLVERTVADAYIGQTGTSVLTLSDDWQNVTIDRTFGSTGVLARFKVQTDIKQAAIMYGDTFRFAPVSLW